MHAFALLADRQRRLREAEEAGRRQVEETRRQQYDEVFRQVVGVHGETIDSYLEDLLVGAQGDVSDEQGTHPPTLRPHPRPHRTDLSQFRRPRHAVTPSLLHPVTPLIFSSFSPSPPLPLSLIPHPSTLTLIHQHRPGNQVHPLTPSSHPPPTKPSPPTHPCREHARFCPPTSCQIHQHPSTLPSLIPTANLTAPVYSAR